jgi:AcrR family transcriptional regulator
MQDTNQEQVVDGRHLRGSRTKKKISEALQTLLRNGNLSPTAEELATAAGASLRTLYRHYEDIEALYRELAAQIDADILPVLMKPYTSTDWREQLLSAVERKAGIYERILPLKAAGDLRRYRSAYLMDIFKRSIVMERTQIEAILPEDLAEREALLYALEPVTSFSMWKRMRYDQGLSSDDAAATVRHIVTALIRVQP